MKNILLLIVLTISVITNAQTLNWAGIKSDPKNILSFSTSAEYGLNYTIGYAYKLKSKTPIILHTEYSFPSGNDLIDDFKTKVGGQILIYKIGNFHFSSGIDGIFRRYQNNYARLLNFGGDFYGTIGYYKSKWFVATDFGFDKAIITHFKHSEAYKQNFPGVQDGWYEPSAGGNFHYGLQGGYSWKKFDVYLKAGKLVEQDVERHGDEITGEEPPHPEVEIAS